MWYHVKQQLPNSAINVIVDLASVDSIGKRREITLMKQHYSFKTSLSQHLNLATLAHDEALLLHQADIIIVNSPKAQQRLVELAPRSEVAVITNAVTVHPRYVQPKQIPRLLYVASLDDLANSHAIEFFCRKVLPLFNQIYVGDFVVDIVGFSPNETVIALDDLELVYVWPDVADLAPFYQQATLVICPTRFGVSAKLSILEAMSYFTPVVSTTYAAEGLAITDGHDILLANDPLDFAILCGRLINNQDFNTTIAENGHYLVKQHYCNYTIERQLAQLIDGLSTFHHQH